jgi:hypothetical protein
MKRNELINAFLKRPLVILMALLCIVFSSASKRLIEQRLAPYLTVSQTLGKKIKTGSRDKRHFFNAQIAPEHQAAPDLAPDLLFLVSSLAAAVLTFIFGARYTTVFSSAFQVAPSATAVPLYLRAHNLRV